MSSLDYLDLCRLCLVKDRASVPIFEGEGDVRQIFLKIAACLPVKVVRGDKLPKKICDDCVYKVEQFYQFWNTTANVEKQLLQWLGDVGMEDKQAYVSGVLNPDQSVEGRLNANVIQQTDEHQNNMGMNMMDTMNLDMPMMMQTEQSQMTTMNSNDTNVQTIQAVPGTSVRPPQQERRKDDEDESSEDEDNSDDECDADEGLSVKEETEETANRTIEPTFVNVSLPCDEAGPSGLQQQKINEMSDMVMAQSTDGDPKSGFIRVEDHIYSKPNPDWTEENIKLGKTTIKEDVDQDYDNVETVDESLEMEEYVFETEDEIQNEEEIEIDVKDLKEDIEEESKIQIEGIEEKIGEFLKVNTKPKIKIVVGKKLKRVKDKSRKQKRGQNKNEKKKLGQCVLCDKVFLNEQKLKKHVIKAHTKDRPFPCIQCDKHFKTEEFLKIHMKQHNKRFICDICGVSKVSNYDLQLHKKKHNKEYVVFCKICEKGFYTNQTLERHVVTHTGEKPFLCKICNQSYASAAYLNTHMKAHEKKEIHKCHICNFESHWKAALKTHLRIHTGENQFSCQVCGKLMSSRNYLPIHMRIHTGEKPHICEICGKAFSVKKYLIVHSRTHTGEKPYQCKICKKRFTQQGSLSSHMKFHCKDK